MVHVDFRREYQMVFLLQDFRIFSRPSGLSSSRIPRQSERLSKASPSTIYWAWRHGRSSTHFAGSAAGEIMVGRWAF